MTPFADQPLSLTRTASHPVRGHMASNRYRRPDGAPLQGCGHGRGLYFTIAAIYKDEEGEK